MHSWSIAFDNAKTRLGSCNYGKKNISISKHFLPSLKPNQLKDLILHEVAHALSGHGNWHNNKWKEKAKQIGCSSIARTSKIAVEKKGLYTAICPNCKREFQAHRQRDIACGICCKQLNNNQYTAKYKIAFKKN